MLGTLEYTLMIILPLGCILTVVFFNQFLKLSYIKRCRNFFVARGMNGKTIERMVVLSTLLSLWFAIAQHLITSWKEDHREEQEFAALVKVFEEARTRHLNTLDLIIKGKVQHFAGIPATEFRSLSTNHIELLVRNNLAVNCYKLDQLFSLKDELNKVNLAIPSIREMSGFSVENSMRNIWMTLDIDEVAKSALNLYTEVEKTDDNCDIRYSD
ncbi:hypothetical protein ACP7H9_00105 [Idiomarina sp. ST20R2A10]|uniref:hypothetical protein n=1 Tax=Idiomarina sp. ST20R2A10 TaxID=3418369 RepID=UPI003EC5D890